MADNEALQDLVERARITEVITSGPEADRAHPPSEREPLDSPGRTAGYGIVLRHRVPLPFRPRSGRNVRAFVGSYDFHLVLEGQWKISLIRFNLKFIDGNATLGAGTVCLKCAR